MNWIAETTCRLPLQALLLVLCITACGTTPSNGQFQPPLDSVDSDAVVLDADSTLDGLEEGPDGDGVIGTTDVAEADTTDASVTDGTIEELPPDSIGPDGTDTLATTDVDSTTDTLAETDTIAESDVYADTDTAVSTDVTVPACVPADCDDGNPCTNDNCSKDTCQHTPIANCKPSCATSADCGASVCHSTAFYCVACNVDADCAVGSRCDDHACIPAVACSSDIACKSSGMVCSKALGFCADCNTPADCASEQTCNAGTCASQTFCTSSKQCPGSLICDTKVGYCVACADHADCPANEYCAADQTCKPDVCVVGQCLGKKFTTCTPSGGGYSAPVTCEDGNICTTDDCVSGEGCKAKPNTVPCDDDNACTEADACMGGTCQPGDWLCDDGNACTVDACEPQSGCTHTPTTAQCDDGNPCTIGENCSSGQCAGAVPVKCNDGTNCTLDSCGSTGCTFTPSNTYCNDLNPCTEDLCETSKSGSVACSNVPLAGPCDDNSACTEGDSCTGGKCLGAVLNCSCQANADCNDSNPCTVDICSEDKKCKYLSSDATCDDNDKCTSSDKCINGKCTGKVVKCGGINDCKLASCDSVLGCQLASMPQGQACSSGLGVCDSKGTCACKSGPGVTDKCVPSLTALSVLNGAVEPPVVTATTKEYGVSLPAGTSSMQLVATAAPGTYLQLKVKGKSATLPIANGFPTEVSLKPGANTFTLDLQIDANTVSYTLYVMVTEWQQTAYIKAPGHTIGTGLATDGLRIAYTVRQADGKVYWQYRKKSASGKWELDGPATYLFTSASKLFDAAMSGDNYVVSSGSGDAMYITGGVSTESQFVEEPNGTGETYVEMSRPVAISDKYVVVGYPRASKFKGAFAVTPLGTSAWVSVVPDTATKSPTQLCGYSVVLAGDKVVIGCPKFYHLYSGQPKNTGVVLAYENQSGQWNNYHNAMTVVGQLENGHYGMSVAVSADKFIAAACGEASGTGVIKYGTGLSNQELETLIPTGWNTGDGSGAYEWGVRMASSGDYLVVASQNDSSPGQGSGALMLLTGAPKAGAVHVYQKDANGYWLASLYLKGSNTEAGDKFSYVAVGPDVIVVGAPGEDSGTTFDLDGDQSDNSAPDSGAIYVFERIK